MSAHLSLTTAALSARRAVRKRRTVGTVDRVTEQPQHPPATRGRTDAQIDEALVGRIAAGDESAVAELYDRHIAIAWAIARRITGDDGAAREVVQDVFVHVWQRAATFDPRRASVEGWLVQVSRSRAIDRRRRDGAARRGGGQVHNALEHCRELPSADDTEIAALRSAHARDVAGALAALSEDHRVVIVAAYFEGLSQQEIAERLGVPVGTVKTRVLRALQRLRHLLEDAQIEVL